MKTYQKPNMRMLPLSAEELMLGGSTGDSTLNPDPVTPGVSGSGKSETFGRSLWEEE